jgi:hypothetical protein
MSGRKFAAPLGTYFLQDCEFMSAELHCRGESVSAYLRLSWQERRDCKGDEDQRDPEILPSHRNLSN